MPKKNQLDIASTLILILAGLGLVVGFLEWLVNLADLSLIGQLHTPGRIMEITAILVIFVIATTLRQILDILRSGQRHS